MRFPGRDRPAPQRWNEPASARLLLGRAHALSRGRGRRPKQLHVLLQARHRLHGPLKANIYNCLNVRI